METEVAMDSLVINQIGAKPVQPYYTSIVKQVEMEMDTKAVSIISTERVVP